MFFEGLPNPHLGGTVLLRGGSKTELNILKNISSLMLFSLYNWRLENSFLMDEYASPPSSTCEFLDDSKDNSPEFPAPKSSNSSTKLEQIEKKNDFNTPKRDKSDVIAESKRIIVETVKDFTDPLHSYKSENHSEVIEKLTVTQLPFANTFRKCLDDSTLSVSPYIVFSVPYLETETGKKSELRKFFPKDIYFSEQFDVSKKSRKKEIDESNLKNDSKEEVCI